MHRAITIKHRIVRRVDIDRAPLATFDTVDLGDEDIRPSAPQAQSSKSTVGSDDLATSHQLLGPNKSGVFIEDGGLKSETIGGNNSKKSLSQAGGEEKESRDDREKDKPGCSEVENVQQSKGAVTEHLPSDTKRLEATLSETGTQKTGTSETKRPEVLASESALQKVATVSINAERSLEKDAPKTTSVSTLARQGTIGRVNIPIKKQDSDSSSSSPGSCNEASFTFQASRPSVGHFDKIITEGQPQECDARKELSDSLLPEYLDPSQILSPSKRKAYERRIERLKVTTSPIARPRSNAPINVVSLVEYAAISAPEPSPATPVVQDKLKITLPPDEFTSKPKTPKLHSAKRQNSEDICFEFTEEFLFSRTKSALVVAEDGQLPLSPRRVLIPPNLTPSTSPKLSASPRLSPDSYHEELAIEASKLIFIQQSETPLKLFGAAADESEDENWANFAEVSQSDENVDHDSSTSTVCGAQENDLQSSTLDVEVEWTRTADTEAFSANESIPSESNDSQLYVLPDGQVNNLYSDFHVPTETTSNIHVQAEAISDYSDQSGSNFQNTSDDDNFNNDIDFTPFSLLKRCSADATLNSSKLVAAVPHVKLHPDYESEEIITIEINQSATGCEKHIGIEIKSEESSESVSPISFDRSNKSWSPTVISRETHDIQQDSSVLSHSNAGAVYPVQPHSISNVSISGTASSFQEVNQYISSDKSQASTEQEKEQETLSYFSPHFSEQVLIPQTSTLHSVNHSIDAALHSPQQVEEKPDLRQRPPSTNPFDIDFEPPVSDPFDLRLPYQATCTNPFLEPHSSVPSDLIVFSSTIDNSSV